MERVRLLGGFPAQYLHKVLQRYFQVCIVACQGGGQAHLPVVIVHVHGKQRGLVQMPRFAFQFSGLVLADGLQQPRQRVFQFQIVQNIPDEGRFMA